MLNSSNFSIILTIISTYLYINWTIYWFFSNNFHYFSHSSPWQWADRPSLGCPSPCRCLFRSCFRAAAWRPRNLGSASEHFREGSGNSRWRNRAAFGDRHLQEWIFSLFCQWLNSLTFAWAPREKSYFRT